MAIAKEAPEELTELPAKIQKISINAPKGVEAFPYSNGQVAFQPLNKGFSYWQRHPIIGWRRHNFKK